MNNKTVFPKCTCLKYSSLVLIRGLILIMKSVQYRALSTGDILSAGCRVFGHLPMPSDSLKEALASFLTTVFPLLV